MDGVLADMDTALRREEERLFGPPKAAPAPPAEPADGAEPADPAVPDAAWSAVAQGAPSIEARGLTRRQQRELWRTVAGIEDFWNTLDETEPGAVRAVAAACARGRWEMLFLTSRPATAGAIVQLQTQHWLQQRGFDLPSVFVVAGSRGRSPRRSTSTSWSTIACRTASTCLPIRLPRPS